MTKKVATPTSAAPPDTRERAAPDHDLRALDDEIADGFLDLLGRNGVAEPECVSPRTAVFIEQLIALIDDQRLQSRHVARQIFNQSDKLIPEDRRQENEDHSKNDDKNGKNDNRSPDPTDPKAGQFPHDWIEEIGQYDAGRKRRHYAAKQMQDEADRGEAGQPIPDDVRCSCGARQISPNDGRHGFRDPTLLWLPAPRAALVQLVPLEEPQLHNKARTR